MRPQLEPLPSKMLSDHWTQEPGYSVHGTLHWSDAAVTYLEKLLYCMLLQHAVYIGNSELHQARETAATCLVFHPYLKFSKKTINQKTSRHWTVFCQGLNTIPGNKAILVGGLTSTTLGPRKRRHCQTMVLSSPILLPL